MSEILNFLNCNVNCNAKGLTLLVLLTAAVMRSIVAIPFAELIELSEINNSFFRGRILHYIVILLFLLFICLYLLTIIRGPLGFGNSPPSTLFCIIISGILMLKVMHISKKERDKLLNPEVPYKRSKCVLVMVSTFIILALIVFIEIYSASQSVWVVPFRGNIVLLLGSCFLLILTISYIYMLGSTNNLKKYEITVKPEAATYFGNPLVGHIVGETKECYILTKQGDGSLIAAKFTRLIKGPAVSRVLAI